MSTTSPDLAPSERLSRLLFSNLTSSPQSSTTPTSSAINNTSTMPHTSSSSEYETDDEPLSGSPRSAGRKLPTSLFTNLPLLRDSLSTPTSVQQDKVASNCAALLSGSHPDITETNSHSIPPLQPAKHINFMHRCMGTYPSGYQSMDASRPWMLYWALAGLAHLGEDVSEFRERTMQTFAPMQNAGGGFGGGHGQTSHVAASYAATLALAIVGGLEVIDRKAMWQWLGSLKQADGGFAMAVGGEIDVRGAYCCLTMANLLHLPPDLPQDAPARRSPSPWQAGITRFTDRVAEWISSCQTFEGGIGAAPGNEAHGAYAFCGLASLCLVDAPGRIIPQHLNVDRLIAWLVARQGATEGGFSGRTNKLVDACYSHWVGGCWALVEAALAGQRERDEGAPPLWSREALVRYTLCCSQVKAGGLRDKPGTTADGYHTCYSLAGLSAAQNIWQHGPGEDGYGSDDEGRVGGKAQEGGVEGGAQAYAWRPYKASARERAVWGFDERDTVGFVHPIFVIPPEVVVRTQEVMGRARFGS